MAEKHKSKYKAPKDLEKSQKTNARKDLKDYTFDDKEGGMNPKSTKEKQLNVLRKTDKPMQDDGKMYPTYNADDRLYKDLEDATYEPKDAAKKMKKRQDNEEKETKDVLQDKIENLTREQKERLVREYIRRKIVKVLHEQTEETPAEETPAEETPAADAEPATDMGAPATDATATDMGAPATDATATPPAEPATDTTATPDMGAPAADTTTPPAAAPAEPKEEKPQPINVDAKDLDQLNQGGTITKVKKLNNILDKLMQDSEVEDQRSFYLLLAKLAIKKNRAIQHKK